jgi:hypothetical protein
MNFQKQPIWQKIKQSGHSVAKKQGDWREIIDIYVPSEQLESAQSKN